MLYYEAEQGCEEEKREEEMDVGKEEEEVGVVKVENEAEGRNDSL